jgi:hypothetical protein
MNWVTIDFEASCLPRHGRSFPIEVGVCGLLGMSSWLIKPSPEWHDWDWTAEAAGLHGITRRQLEQHGLEPQQVVAHVRRAVGSSRVIADSSIDRMWWQTLVGAADTSSTMVIEHVADIFDELGATASQIQLAQQRADWLSPAQHRAGADARWLHTLLSTLTRQVEAATPMIDGSKLMGNKIAA